MEKWILIKRESDEEIHVCKVPVKKGKVDFYPSKGYVWAGPWKTKKKAIKALNEAPSDESMEWKK